MKKPVSKSIKNPDCQLAFSLKDSVSYIRDLLESLEEIARSHGQKNLAHFISAAASEAADVERKH